MSGAQTRNGKAFEYACLHSLYGRLSNEQEVAIVETSQYETSKRFFADAAGELKHRLTMAADAAARVIIRLEPQLAHPNGNMPLYLSLQTDAQGRAGDVRDVLCIRKQNGWEIGLSCKHNHHAVKHSRLSSTIDFGAEWFGAACSCDYFNAIDPLFDELSDMRRGSNGAAKWSDVDDKAGRFYVPMLRAFLDELRRLDNEHPQLIPERLIRYLIGRHDFYKIITNDARRTTRVEGVNLYGTLNRESETHASIVPVARLRLPTRFYHMDLKQGSQTTVEVVCDEGWGVSMRIHSASSRVEPSLKFDVNLISFPPALHTQIEPW
jgi:hypothetical protein